MPFCTRPHICTFLKEIDMKQSGTGLGEGKDTVFKPPSNQKFPYQLKSLFCFLLLSGAPVLRWVGFAHPITGLGVPPNPSSTPLSQSWITAKPLLIGQLHWHSLGLDGFERTGPEYCFLKIRLYIPGNLPAFRDYSVHWKPSYISYMKLSWVQETFSFLRTRFCIPQSFCNLGTI